MAYNAISHDLIGHAACIHMYMLCNEQSDDTYDILISLHLLCTYENLSIHGPLYVSTLWEQSYYL